MSTNIKYCNCGKCSCDNRDYFVGECDVFLCDRMLRGNSKDKVCGVNVIDGGQYSRNIIQYVTENAHDYISMVIVAYVLTYPEPVNINDLDYCNRTPLVICAQLNKPYTLKLIMDFIESEIDAEQLSYAIIEAKRLGNVECVEILQTYKPTLDEKIRCQIEAKNNIDMLFNGVSGRYRQDEINTIFESKEQTIKSIFVNSDC